MPIFVLVVTILCPMKKHLPNFLTLLNLTSGGLGATLALQGDLAHAAMCIWLGGIFDVFDGLLARLLKVQSPLGQQLDSLADLITFGWLPASIMYRLIGQQTTSPYLPFIVLLIPVFSALRLARFNIDTRQTDVFIGLPVPAHAIFISTLPLIIAANKYVWLTAWLSCPKVLAIMVIFTSYLLVANIRLMAFKFTTYAWHANRLKYGFLLTAALLILVLHAEGLALSIVGYGLVSILATKSY